MIPLSILTCLSTLSKFRGKLIQARPQMSDVLLQHERPDKQSSNLDLTSSSVGDPRRR